MSADLVYFDLVDRLMEPSDIKHYKYTTTNSISEVMAVGYFDNAGDFILNIGDKITVVVVDNLNNALRTSAIVYEIFVTGI